MTWHSRAACQGESPDLFFPIGSTGPAVDQIATAKAVCSRCPVVQMCLKWATDSHQETGVWGGLSEDERHARRRRMRDPITSAR